MYWMSECRQSVYLLAGWDTASKGDFSHLRVIAEERARLCSTLDHTEEPVRYPCFFVDLSQDHSRHRSHGGGLEYHGVTYKNSNTLTLHGHPSSQPLVFTVHIVILQFILIYFYSSVRSWCNFGLKYFKLINSFTQFLHKKSIKITSMYSKTFSLLDSL